MRSHTIDPPAVRSSPRGAATRAPGVAKIAGVAMGALCLALALGLVTIIKRYVATPLDPTVRNTPGARATGATPARPIAQVLADARQAMDSRDYPRAGVILQRAIESSPMDQELRLGLAEALIAQEKPADAYAQYEKALVIGPKSAKLHFMAGTVAAKAGMTDRAEEHYSMAQTADPSDAEIPLYLAMVQIKLGKTQPAAGNLLRVVHLQPDRAEAWGTLAELYLADDKATVAQPNIEKARTLQPTSSKWRIVEARIANRLNQPEKAATSLLALDKPVLYKPEVLKVIAESYGMLGKPADAAALYADAAATDAGRTSAEINYQAALWFERGKDAASALKYAKAAAILGNEDARDLVSRLLGTSE